MKQEVPDSIVVRSSAIAGKGVFAARNIGAGKLILAITGPTIMYPSQPDFRLGPDWFNTGRNKWKIPEHTCRWRYLNHSCRPNAGMEGSAHVIAMHAIKIGEEITIDYSCVESAANWRMRCRCGAPECRAVIRSIQYLQEDLFRRYERYIPAFLRREYRKEKIYRKSRRSGRGLFAKRALRRGETLFEVKGPTISYRKPPKAEVGYNWLGLAKGKWLIPYRTDPWCAMRHSCDPNCGLRDGAKVVALRTIRPDEEVTIDNSITEGDIRWSMRCNCGAKRCRKIIHSVHFLPEKTYAKYLPFIPRFLQREYENKGTLLLS